MHILSLQPYFGGSHKAFQTQWHANSRHQWTILSLPPRHWKWRMRHAAVYFAEQLSELGKVDSTDKQFDAIFCSDFLNLAEFKGLAPSHIRDLPTIVYFHENQFAYPSRRYDERDLHFGFTNFTSCLAADQVWFNSAFNRDSFFEGLEKACQKWPDFQPKNSIESVRPKCRIEPPGIVALATPAPDIDDDTTSVTTSADSDVVSLVWAARWEHDKNPDLLLESLQEMQRQQIKFRISVMGESFRRVPDAFEQIRIQFEPQIDRWGYQTAEEYSRTLREADVFVSTADHEFFGISAAEAIICGLFPVLPNRLAYPELIRCSGNSPAGHSNSEIRRDLFLYDGTPSDLCQKVEYFCSNQNTETVLSTRKMLQTELLQELEWQTRAPSMDQRIDEICRCADSGKRSPNH